MRISPVISQALLVQLPGFDVNRLGHLLPNNQTTTLKKMTCTGWAIFTGLGTHASDGENSLLDLWSAAPWRCLHLMTRQFIMFWTGLYHRHTIVGRS